MIGSIEGGASFQNVIVSLLHKTKLINKYAVFVRSCIYKKSFTRSSGSITSITSIHFVVIQVHKCGNLVSFSGYNRSTCSESMDTGFWWDLHVAPLVHLFGSYTPQCNPAYMGRIQRVFGATHPVKTKMTLWWLCWKINLIVVNNSLLVYFKIFYSYKLQDYLCDFFLKDRAQLCCVKIENSQCNNLLSKKEDKVVNQLL